MSNLTPDWPQGEGRKAAGLAASAAQPAKAPEGVHAHGSQGAAEQGERGEVTGLPVGRVAGLHAFQQLVREVLAKAAERRWQKLVLCDPNYEAWPLAEAQPIQGLQQWAGQGREFVMLAHRFDWVQARQARMVHWRTMWSHVIACGAIATSDREAVQTFIWTPEWAFSLQDGDHLVGISSENARFRAELARKLENLKMRSQAGFPVNVLGL